MDGYFWYDEDVDSPTSGHTYTFDCSEEYEYYMEDGWTGVSSAFDESSSGVGYVLDFDDGTYVENFYLIDG